ncbi:hypothetical protein HDU81_008494 [Chytriomyces hyalinus]|nr:hypothetical protein HDU81_008494 [Chytriomyces hyalinus]
MARLYSFPLFESYLFPEGISAYMIPSTDGGLLPVIPDPVNVLRNFFKLGAPLCVIYNELAKTTTGVFLNVDDVSGIRAPFYPTKPCKDNLYKFITACRSEIRLPQAQELSGVSKLYNDDKRCFTTFLKLVEDLIVLIDAAGNTPEPRPLPFSTELSPDLVNPFGYRARVIKELIETERQYIFSLEELQRYQNELASREVFSKYEMNQLFSNLDELLDFQRRFMVGMESTLNLGVAEQRIGQLFILNEEAFEVYYPFCGNYENASDFVINRGEELKHMGHIIQPHSITAYLIKPLQRLMKYPHLLKQLIKNTDAEAYPDMDELKDGLDAIKRVTERLIKVENERVKQDLMERLEDWKDLKAVTKRASSRKQSNAGKETASYSYILRGNIYISSIVRVEDMSDTEFGIFSIRVYWKDNILISQFTSDPAACSEARLTAMPIAEWGELTDLSVVKCAVLEIVSVSEMGVAAFDMLERIQALRDEEESSNYEKLRKSKAGNTFIQNNQRANSANQTMPATQSITVHAITSKLPREMLALVLSDGVHETTAIEMEQLKEFSLATPIGSKVLIKNPTLKRGILHLRSQNISFLPGQNIPPIIDAQLFLKYLISHFETLLKHRNDSTALYPPDLTEPPSPREFSRQAHNDDSFDFDATMHSDTTKPATGKRTRASKSTASTRGGAAKARGALGKRGAKSSNDLDQKIPQRTWNRADSAGSAKLEENISYQTGRQAQNSNNPKFSDYNAEEDDDDDLFAAAIAQYEQEARASANTNSKTKGDDDMFDDLDDETLGELLPLDDIYDIPRKSSPSANAKEEQRVHSFDIDEGPCKDSMDVDSSEIIPQLSLKRSATDLSIMPTLEFDALIKSDHQESSFPESHPLSHSTRTYPHRTVQDGGSPVPKIRGASLPHAKSKRSMSSPDPCDSVPTFISEISPNGRDGVTVEAIFYEIRVDLALKQMVGVLEDGTGFLKCVFSTDLCPGLHDIQAVSKWKQEIMAREYRVEVDFSGSCGLIVAIQPT